MSVDTEKYGSRDGQRQREVQNGLVGVLERAARAAGLRRERWETQPGGDGELAVLPGVNPEPEPRLVDDYVLALDAALAEYNRSRYPEDRMRLRLALHFGVVAMASNGFSGDAVVAVSRLVDSTALRTALAAAPGAHVAVALSDRVYRDVVAHGYTRSRAGDYRPVDVQQKEFAESAWFRVPGADVHELPLGPVALVNATTTNTPDSDGVSADTGTLKTRHEPDIQNNFQNHVDARRANFGISYGRW